MPNRNQRRRGRGGGGGGAGRGGAAAGGARGPGPALTMGFIQAIRNDPPSTNGNTASANGNGNSASTRQFSEFGRPILPIYGERSFAEIYAHAESFADMVDDFSDDPEELEDFLASIDNAAIFFDREDSAGWHGGVMSDENLLGYIQRDKVSRAPRARQVLDRSYTVEEFKTNLRKEFATELASNGTNTKSKTNSTAGKSASGEAGPSSSSNGKTTNAESSDAANKKKGRATDHLYATADFCLIPMGTSSPSVGEHIAECARVLETFTKRGLTFKMHGYGTNLEGPWHLVSMAIEACHSRLHEQGVPRIATDIRIGTKAQDQQQDKPAWAASLTENERKLESVQRRLRGLDLDS